MTEKQFKIEFDTHRYFLVIDIVNERCLARLDTMADARAWLEVYEMLSDECEQLKEENEDLNEELMEYDSFVLLYKEQRDELKKENEQLIKDNFELQGLLGDVRALLRLSKVDDAISRIDKFERSMKK